jgi:hypothetical protein
VESGGGTVGNLRRDIFTGPIVVGKVEIFGVVDIAIVAKSFRRESADRFG